MGGASDVLPVIGSQRHWSAQVSNTPRLSITIRPHTTWLDLKLLDGRDPAIVLANYIVETGLGPPLRPTLIPVCFVSTLLVKVCGLRGVTLHHILDTHFPKCDFGVCALRQWSADNRKWFSAHASHPVWRQGE